MGLRLYTHLAGRKRILSLRRDQRAHVRRGPTVYDYRPHRQRAPGHRLRRAVPSASAHLRPEHVTYVRNITDVDDKINARAAKDFPDLLLNAASGKSPRNGKQFHET